MVPQPRWDGPCGPVETQGLGGNSQRSQVHSETKVKLSQQGDADGSQ